MLSFTPHQAGYPRRRLIVIRKSNNSKEVFTDIYVLNWDGGRENDIIIVP